MDAAGQKELKYAHFDYLQDKCSGEEKKNTQPIKTSQRKTKVAGCVWT